MLITIGTMGEQIVMRRTLVLQILRMCTTSELKSLTRPISFTKTISTQMEAQLRNMKVHSDDINFYFEREHHIGIKQQR